MEQNNTTPEAGGGEIPQDQQVPVPTPPNESIPAPEPVPVPEATPTLVPPPESTPEPTPEPTPTPTPTPPPEPATTPVPTQVLESVPVSVPTSVAVSRESLTLKEKYFQVEPEGRIRRYQYFVRSLIPSILLFLVIFGGSILAFPLLFILGKFILVLGPILLGALYWMFYNLAKVNSIKRAHDFGSDGKIFVYIITASFAMSVIGLIVGFLQSFGVLPTADIGAALQGMNTPSGDDPMMALRQLSEAMKDATPLYQRVLDYISRIISIASLITWLVLLFRPGVAGDNQYGKDASKNKVSFLG